MKIQNLFLKTLAFSILLLLCLSCQKSPSPAQKNNSSIFEQNYSQFLNSFEAKVTTSHWKEDDANAAPIRDTGKFQLKGGKISLDLDRNAFKTILDLNEDLPKMYLILKSSGACNEVDLGHLLQGKSERLGPNHLWSPKSCGENKTAEKCLAMNGYQKGNTEKINNIDCTIYEKNISYPGAQGKRIPLKTRLWVPKNGSLLFVKSETSAENNVSTFELEGIQMGASEIMIPEDCQKISH